MRGRLFSRAQPRPGDPPRGRLASGVGMGVILFVLIISLGGIPGLLPPLPTTAEIQMGMVVVLAVCVLIVLLCLTANIFSAIGLADARYALGLPDGSIRALIALFLIMIFIIVSVYLFRAVAGRGVTLKNLTLAEVGELGERLVDVERNIDGTFNATLSTRISAAGEQLGLQLVTILGTLVTAVSAFYFGTTAVTTAQQAAAAAIMGAQASPGALSIDSITPNSSQATAGSVAVILTGTGFVNGAQVRLRRTGTPDIDATNVTVVNASRITCTVNLTNQPTGQWDVVVVNPGGGQTTNAAAFQIT
jgi:IPT/TIG domain-containing protein